MPHFVAILTSWHLNDTCNHVLFDSALATIKWLYMIHPETFDIRRFVISVGFHTFFPLARSVINIGLKFSREWDIAMNI